MKNAAEVPTDLQMSEWYATIHRVLTIVNDHPAPTNEAFTPAPLREDILDCVERSFLEAILIEKTDSAPRYQLKVTEKGHFVYNMLRSHLVATGQVTPRPAQVFDENRVNPFLNMD